MALVRNPALTAEQRRIVTRAAIGPLLRRSGDQLGVHARASLSVRLTDDAELRDLNSRFLGDEATTDVLAFPGEPEERVRRVGDIAISVERAVAQAPGEPADELRLLAVHGLLHCLGHDHAEGQDAQLMEGETRRLLPGQEVPPMVPV